MCLRDPKFRYVGLHFWALKLATTLPNDTDSENDDNNISGWPGHLLTNQPKCTPLLLPIPATTHQDIIPPLTVAPQASPAPTQTPKPPPPAPDEPGQLPDPNARPRRNVKPSLAAREAAESAALRHSSRKHSARVTIIQPSPSVPISTLSSSLVIHASNLHTSSFCFVSTLCLGKGLIWYDINAYSSHLIVYRH
jgi:hypothetical protein